MRFCPQCGVPLLAGAKFCVECGRALASTASGAGEGDRPVGHVEVHRNPAPVTTAFVIVFVAITVLGLGAAAFIFMRTPEVVRERVAATPPSAPSPNVAGNPTAATAPQVNAPPQTTAANPAAGGTQTGDLPAGHPRIELPTEARTFIDKIEKEARAKPKDVTAWNKFGAVSMRAAMFDQSYYAKAEEAYGHVLKQEPDNLDALRGIGDIDYDKQHFDQAIAAYEHFLKKKPDDPEVRTDLGTMYLYTGNADQAIVQYKKAIASKPGFFQAYYNMGIAYAQMNKPDDASAALKQALALAPDENARTQVNELVAKLNNPAAATAPGVVAAPGAPAAPAPGAAGASPKQSVAAAGPAGSASAKSSPAPAAAGTLGSPAAQASTSPAAAKDFHGAIEQMVRGLPIAGPKVGSVQWPADLKAKVVMDNFPMDQMPPFAKNKFLSDLKAGIDTAKKDNNVSAPVELDIVDGASGRVMQTITQ
ncbi:MAG TPA: tetratricopeptide repeat protein [Candidatus Acidoferrales bacterium]|nr:tetratricopeptide repeat protein [Candidatus Acidoferrales bacterium]